MATLYDLAMQYLNQSLPKTFKYDRTNQPESTPPVNVLPQTSNVSTAGILPIQGGGGNDFSVYNPDPNNTRDSSRYIERPYKSAVYNDAFSMMGDPMANEATGALNADGLMSYPGDKGKSAMQLYLENNILGKVTGMLPVNKTGILQNELLGSGFSLNNIGQIVSGGGDYNTAANVMAGYNASKITEKTFDDRIKMATEKMTPGEYKDKRIAAILEAKQNFIDAKGRTKTVFDAESLEKNPDYISQDIINQKMQEALEGEDDSDLETDPTNILGTFKNKNIFEINNIVDYQRTKDLIEAAKIKEQNAMDPGTPPIDYYVPDGTSGGGAGQGIDISGAGTVRSSDNNFQGDSGPTNQQESDYGYSTDFGFARGGIVNLRVKN